VSEEERTERCPDGGYCHGSTFAAGSPPCSPGDCFRVRHAAPLSGVYPGDRWPDEVRAREVRARVDAICPRVLPGGLINTQHVAIESTLRERYALPAYVPELDGPGSFVPRPTDPEGA
jgi:hypothetical protein